MSMSKQAVERILQVVNVLSQTSRGMSRDDLRWQVLAYRTATSDSSFERMFERDKATLRHVGLLHKSSVEDERGIFLYRLNTGFSGRPFQNRLVTESAALTLAWSAQIFAEGRLQRIALTGISKLGWSAQSAQKFWGEQPNRFEDHEMLVDALDAVANRKLIQICYEDTQTGERELKTLAALGVGARFGRWYLAGAYEPGHKPRLFRFDRIDSLMVLDKETPSELDFSMSDQLKSLSSVVPLGLWVQQPNHPHLAVIPSYSLAETITQALMGGYEILPEPSRDSTPSVFAVESSYQHRAFEEYLRVRNALYTAHSEALSFQRQEYEFEPVSQTRRRASAEEQTTQLLSISQVIMENPGIALQDLAHRFGMTPAKLRKQLESLWATLDPERFEIHIEHDAVSISSSFDFGTAMELTGVETALLFLSIELNRHLQASQNRFDEAQAILLTAHPQYKHVASALSIVEDYEIVLLRRAISQSRIVDFDYVREHHISHRSVVPQELLFQEGNYYVAGFCLDRQAPRVFRVDRMEELALLHNGIDDLPVYKNPLRWNVEPTGHTEYSYVKVDTDVDSPSLWMLRQHATAVAHLDDSQILQIPLRNPAWLIEATISARGMAQILYPQPVREQLLAQVEGI